MSQLELLKKVVEVLDAARIDYMVTGSFASSLHGRPRSTHDIDLIVDLGWTGLRAILDAFPAPDFYISEEAAREAMANGGTFNLLDAREGGKVDFWLLTEHPFDTARFERRREDRAWGFQVWVSSPEDTILQKLRWARMMGGSEKQTDDARQIALTQGAAIEAEYVDRWATHLGVVEAWNGIRHG